MAGSGMNAVRNQRRPITLFLGLDDDLTKLDLRNTLGCCFDEAWFDRNKRNVGGKDVISKGVAEEYARNWKANNGGGTNQDIGCSPSGAVGVFCAIFADEFTAFLFHFRTDNESIRLPRVVVERGEQTKELTTFHNLCYLPILSFSLCCFAYRPHPSVYSQPSSLSKGKDWYGRSVVTTSC